MHHTEYITIRQENSKLLQAYQAHTTVANWDAYIKHCADELTPALSKMLNAERGQSFMQQQLDDGNITEDEWSAIVD